MTFYRDEKRDNAIQGNVRINATGVFFFCFSFSFVTLIFFARQSRVLFQMSESVDEATSKETHSCTSFGGNDYELVFSDEFEVRRTFRPGDFVSFFWFLRFFSSFSSLFAAMNSTTT